MFILYNFYQLLPGLSQGYDPVLGLSDVEAGKDIGVWVTIKLDEKGEHPFSAFLIIRNSAVLQNNYSNGFLYVNKLTQDSQTIHLRLLTYISFDSSKVVKGKIEEKVSSQFEPEFFEVVFGFSLIGDLVINSTFNSETIQRLFEKQRREQ